MDAISYSYADKQAKRITKFNANPDSDSGIVTVPRVIEAGESVTVPAGRVAVLPNVQIDGTLNIEGEVFIPAGSSVDFSTGIKVNGEKLTMSIPTAYHIYNGRVEATINANNTELTTTTTKNYTTSDYIFCYSNNKLYDCILNSTSGALLTNTTYFTEVSAGDISINALVPYANGIDINGSKVSIEYKNETITGLTLTQGKNYVYSKNDGTYGASSIAPSYGKDNPLTGDFFNLNTLKWYDSSNTEITPRTYLDCVVYADHNGQVSYVEELPKTTYFDEVKANEFKGKNACTAWVNFDGTTTPPTIRDSYNVKSVVRITTGIFDIYFKEDMDNVNYTFSVSGAEGSIREYYVRNTSYLGLSKIRVECGDVGFTQGINPNTYVVQIFGGKN